jgi:trk system potassium uptake protein TrkA
VQVLIVGGGKLTYFLSRALLAKGYGATLVIRDASEADWLARRLKTVIVHGDGTRPRTLEEAEIGRKDLVLAATASDEDNFVVCLLSERKFGVPLALALVNDPDNERVFRELGVRPIFSPVRLLAELIGQRIASESVVNLYPFGESGLVTLTEIVVAKDSPVASRPLREVPLPEQSLVAGIVRAGEAVIPRGQTLLLPGDRLIVAALPQAYPTVLRILTGDRPR